MKYPIYPIFVLCILLGGCRMLPSAGETPPVSSDQLLGTYEVWEDEGGTYNRLRLDGNGKGFLTVWYDFSPNGKGTAHPVKWSVTTNSLQIVCEVRSPCGVYWGDVYAKADKAGIGNKVWNLRLTEQGIEWTSHYLLVRQEVLDLARARTGTLMQKTIAESAGRK